MADTANWIGASGNRYTYYVSKRPANFTDTRGGNYIFCFVNSSKKWEAVYIGETGDLSDRFDGHHALRCIDQHGATHIHAHTNTSRDVRRAEEADLIDNYSPPCNK